MSYSRLFIFIEGDDDNKFFSGIIKPKLQRKYDSIKIVKYSGYQKKKINNFIKSIKAMRADYFYVADINSTPCVTAKKKKILDKIGDIDNDRIIVVVKEIESWYIAGLDCKKAKKFKIKDLGNTNTITKERFNNLIPDNFSSRIDFLLEILKDYSIEFAKQKNKSFEYFFNKYVE